MKVTKRQKKKVKGSQKRTDGIASEYISPTTRTNTLPESLTTQDLSLSKLSISKVTVSEFVDMLPNPDKELMYEFLDAIELPTSAPQRERAAMIEAGNSRINRIKMVANAYEASVKLGHPHEGILAILHEEGIDPENVERDLKSDIVHLKNLQAQYEEENKGEGITPEWFDTVLKSASDYHKYHISDNITLKRFAQYYKELANGK